MDPRLLAGTPMPAGDPHWAYTKEQLEKLETLKDPSFTLGVAKADYVNHVLWPDGSIDTDLAGARAAVKALRDGIEDGTAPEWAGKDAAALTRLLQDITDHAAEQRFLFIISTHDEPRYWFIYFQCAVEGNPDLPTRTVS